MKRIVVINRINTDNFGDKIIGLCMNKLFSDDSIKVIHLDYAFLPKKGHSFWGKLCWQLKKIFYPQYCKWKLRNADSVIIGGGELISSEYVFANALEKWNRILMNLKCSKFLFSIGVNGQFPEPLASKFRKILDQFSMIYVRDEKSYRLITKEIGVDNNVISIIPDCVFTISDFFTPSIRSLDNPKSLFGVTDLSRIIKHRYIDLKDNDDCLMNFYYDQWLKIKYESDNIVLFYNTNNDKKTATKFMKYLEEKGLVCQIASIKNEFEFLDLINDSSIVYSPRMHACICALAFGSAARPMVISDKMADFERLYINDDFNIQYIKEAIYISVKKIKSQFDS